MLTVKYFGAILQPRQSFISRVCIHLSQLPLFGSSTFSVDRIRSSISTMPPKRATRKAATKSTKLSEKESESNGAVPKQVRKKRARKVDDELDESEEEQAPVVKPQKVSKQTKKPSKPAKRSKVEDSDDEETIPTEKAASTSSDYGKKGAWKIVSWNVNGIRSRLSQVLEYIEKESADVFCIQETKCSEDKLPSEVTEVKGYKSYFLAGDREGLSGVGILTKKTPLNVTYGIGQKEHDSEGRVITLEFDKFYLVNSYVPNAGRGLVRLDYRMSWDEAFRKYLCDLKEKKSVILTGDLNVAHNEIDLKNPKTNKRNAGFTDEERENLTSLLDQGFIDSFRKLYPTKEGAYTFWTYMRNARANNVGWRLDYFIVSDDFIEQVIDNEIRNEVMGSDHCPIVLHLK